MKKPDWERKVAEQLADSEAGPFLASRKEPPLVVLAGGHTGYGMCWCQAEQVPHGDHTHPRHREVQD